MHAGDNVARSGSGASARGCEAAGRSNEGKMRGVWHGGNGERAVVTRDTDAGGGDELADDESVRDCGLYGGRGGCGGAAAAGGQSGCAGDVGELRVAGSGDHGECAVVAGDGDACDGNGLSGGKSVRRAGGDGYEKTVFRCAAWTCGNGDGCGLRCAGGAGDDRDDYVFVDHGWSRAGTALANAIEIGVVILAR